ncbi:hypothetical protein LPKW2_04570 [Lactiplantibacillus pentosus]|nr:hypothetical protein LPKW2_04570 [Lactiplantibacillus pentosus]
MIEVKTVSRGNSLALSLPKDGRFKKANAGYSSHQKMGSHIHSYHVLKILMLVPSQNSQ